jgi:hypothetical protein
VVVQLDHILFYQGRRKGCESCRGVIALEVLDHVTTPPVINHPHLMQGSHSGVDIPTLIFLHIQIVEFLPRVTCNTTTTWPWGCYQQKPVFISGPSPEFVFPEQDFSPNTGPEAYRSPDDRSAGEPCNHTGFHYNGC